MFAGGGGGGQPSAVIDIYDDATGIWSTATLSQARGVIAATTIGSQAIFAGGYVAGCLSPATCRSDVVDIYDDAIGAIYCSPAAANSTGRSATVTAQGFPGSVAQGYALLSASHLPPQSIGYFLNSLSQGFTANPGGSQGHLCLSGATGRYATTPFNSGAEGAATLQVDLAGTPTPTGMVSITAGQTPRAMRESELANSATSG